MIESGILRHVAFVFLFVCSFVYELWTEKNPDYSALGFLSLTMFALGSSVLYFMSVHIIIYLVFSPNTWVFSGNDPRESPARSPARSPSRGPVRLSTSSPMRK